MALTLALVLLVAWFALIALLLIFKPAHARELARMIPDCLRLAGRIARDPPTSRSTRIILGACALYLAFPIDIVPDFLPVVGQLDDVVVVALVMRLVVRRAGRERVSELWPGTEAGLRAVLRLA